MSVLCKLSIREANAIKRGVIKIQTGMKLISAVMLVGATRAAGDAAAAFKARVIKTKARKTKVRKTRKAK